jgi:ubiquinone/menaquinone biosynthesis C-methylase UbiE
MRDRTIEVISQNVWGKMFSPHREILPHLDDTYEIELAFYEDQLLTDEELLRNAAYFGRVDGQFTRHFLVCVGESLRLPDHSSARLKSFFQKNQFRTGYATHGLFPYRGKFHPQMVKGLMNVMGLKPAEAVLDPMMGSGTVLVEASLMGINSVGVDTSPFCRFMAQTKIDALTMSLSRARKALANHEEVYEHFGKKVGKPRAGSKSRGGTRRDFSAVMEPGAQYVTTQDRSDLSAKDRETSDTYNFLLLAYLDSAGYSERSKRKSPVEQFRAILERYVFVAEKIQRVLARMESELGEAQVLVGDARSLPLEDESIDGIIFSPPYSFAIDYLDNDSFHLRYLGVDIENVRESMVGLRGRGLSEKFELYQDDMDKVLAECGRVLRPGRICSIVVGTNDNQLSKAFGISPEEVRGIHEMLTDQATEHGFRLVKTMSRPITGISNTMRREYVLFLCRE